MGWRVISTCTLAASLLLSGCTHRVVKNSPPPPDAGRTGERGYVDLQPGAVLRVVVPILKSGAYVLPDSSFEQHGTTIVVHDKGDFIGFERDFYDVRPRHPAGIQLQFRHAEITENGATRVEHRAALPLVSELAAFRYVRIVFLQRLSATDHDQALVGANDENLLARLTREVIGGAGCSAERGGFCEWVPLGVAVVQVSPDHLRD